MAAGGEAIGRAPSEGLRDALRAELCRLIFGELVPESELSDDDDLIAVGLDSMGILKAVAWLEKRLGNPFPDGAVKPENFRSLRKLLAFVATV
jgi:acyl carrier protein